MGSSKPPVLVVVRRPPLAPEAIAVADLLDRDTRYRPIVATERAGLQFLSDTEKARFDYVDYDGTPLARTNPVPAPAPARSVARTLVDRTRDLVLRVSNRIPLAAFVLSVRRHSASLADVCNLLARTAPAAAIVFDDRAPGHPMLLLHEAKRRGIPTIFLPFAASTVESDLLIRNGRIQNQVDRGIERPIKRAFATAMPDHVLQQPDGRYLFFPWPTMAALRLFGLHQTRPWVMGGGDSSIAGLFDEQERLELEAHGVAPARLRLIGQPATDALFRAARDRDRLRAGLGIAPADKLLICAVPQTAEHGMTSWSDHNRETEGLFDAITASGARVVLSLHPKSKPESYRAMADRFGARIEPRPLAEILPAADLFVAGFSSTVRWAAALGIPTVVADLTRFRYTMYDALPAIPKVTTVSEVGAHVRRLVEDDAHRRSTAKALREQATIYATLDGRVGERLLAALDELTASHNPHRLPEGTTP